MEYCGSAVMGLRDFYEAFTPLDAPHQAFPVRSNAISAPVVKERPADRPPNHTPPTPPGFGPIQGAEPGSRGLPRGARGPPPGAGVYPRAWSAP